MPIFDAIVIGVFSFAVSAFASIIALLASARDEQIIKENNGELIGGAFGALALAGIVCALFVWRDKEDGLPLMPVLTYFIAVFVWTMFAMYMFTNLLKKQYTSNKDTLISSLVLSSAAYGALVAFDNFFMCQLCNRRSNGVQKRSRVGSKPEPSEEFKAIFLQRSEPSRVGTSTNPFNT